MKNSILTLLSLLLFLTAIVAFGGISAKAYNNTNYMYDCPTDFPYCYEKVNTQSKNCPKPEKSYNYCSKDEMIKTNQKNNYCMIYKITGYYYPCNYDYNKIDFFSSNYDYCAYLNAADCVNIPVYSKNNSQDSYNTTNYPKNTYDYCSDLYIVNCVNIPTYSKNIITDPVYGCNSNMSNSYCYSDKNENKNSIIAYPYSNKLYESTTSKNTNTYYTPFDADMYSDTTGVGQNYFNTFNTFETAFQPYNNSFIYTD